MRIVFIGTVAFSARTLAATLAAGGEVVAALTLPPERGGFHGDYVDLGPVAAAHRVPLHRVADVNDPETIRLIRSLRPDVVFAFGWSQLLGRELLELAPCIGSHPALLPRDRGRHPITWVLVDGLPESGLTFLWLDDGADTGDILWQRSFALGPDDDAADVYARIEELAEEAIREFLPQLERGDAPRMPQDDGRATYRRKRTDADRIVDWRLPRRRIHDLVRGLARPYVGAVARIAGQDVLVWRTRIAVSEPSGADSHEPGDVASVDDELVVRAGDGWLVLAEVEPRSSVAPGARFEVPA